MTPFNFKPTLAATVPALSLFLLFQACGGGGNATAQEAPDPAEGVWEANVTIKDCSSGAVLTSFRGAQVLHRGGTLTDTNSAPTNSRGPGFGVWSRSGAAYTSKFRFFTYDAAGVVSGVTRVTRTFTIASDGKSQTSTNTNQLEDLNGVAIRNSCGSDTSTRVL